MDGGAWWATVPGVEKTRLSDFTLTICILSTTVKSSQSAATQKYSMLNE